MAIQLIFVGSTRLRQTKRNQIEAKAKVDMSETGVFLEEKKAALLINYVANYRSLASSK